MSDMNVLKKLLLSTTFLIISACDRTQSKTLDFSAKVYYDIKSLPEHVAIDLKNDGDDYICLENTEINGRGGNVVVDNYFVPDVGYPSYILEKDGVYLGDGITIVGPKTRKLEIIELVRLTDNTKSVRNITMKLRYFKCEDVFRKNHTPKVYILSSEWKKRV